jgi:hypothetical protein
MQHQEKKRMLQKKIYCNIRGESGATTKKQNKTSQELLCNIRETHVATTKKRYHCNIPHHLLQH